MPIKTDHEEELAQAMRQPNMLALCIDAVARTAAFTLQMRARGALAAIRDGVVRKQVIGVDGTVAAAFESSGRRSTNGSAKEGSLPKNG